MWTGRGCYGSHIPVPCIWDATVEKASLGAQVLLSLTGHGSGGEDSGPKENTSPSPEIGAVLKQGCHCPGGAMGTKKQGGRREILRADPAPPLTFPIASTGASSCFPLVGGRG